MNISLNELFKYSYVITINDEQHDLLCKIFNYHQLPIPIKYRGIKLSNNRYDSWFKELNTFDFNSRIARNIYCSSSHVSIIKMAKCMDFPFVCIFEEDAYPCIDIKKKLEYYLNGIPDNCLSLILGHSGGVESKKIFNNNKYFDMYSRIGAHAYIVFRNGYDKYIKAFEDWTMFADRVIEKIDNVLSTKDNLFIQYSQEKSMNNHDSYLWCGRTQEQILKEFPNIEKILN